MASPDHAATVREQLRHLGPWRGAIGEEALDALVAALAQAEHERDQAISVREVEWRMSAKEINAAAIDRADRAERERDQAVEALRKIVACDYRGNEPTEQRIARDALASIENA